MKATLKERARLQEKIIEQQRKRIAVLKNEIKYLERLIGEHIKK